MRNIEHLQTAAITASSPAASDFPLPESARLLPLAEQLLHWYDQNARALPWRENPAPYRVWVSEMMLQQTRVEAVIPYFTRFLAALPDIPALANIGEDALLKLWEGLGYYSRARNLQKAARILVGRFGGELPRSYEELLKLPGLGEYAAGAVASIAFNIPVPAVDGNVLRVLARLTASADDIAQPAVKKSFRALAQSMQPPARAGDFNQALMELGALVCLPGGAPRCETCPLRDGCEGYRLGCAGRLPVKAPPKPRRIEEMTVLVVVSGGRVLLRRRPEKGLLASMWEFPYEGGFLTERQAALRLKDSGAGAVSLRALPGNRHIFSHIEWHMHAFLAETDDFPPCDDCVWSDIGALFTERALPGAFQPYADFLRRP